MAERYAVTRVLASAVCVAGIAYCSAAPEYAQLPQDCALLRLSMAIDGVRLQPCRPLAIAEIERLPANMRQAEHCPRERASVHVQLAVDGAMLVDERIAPRGWARDGAATIYRRVVLASGNHHIRAAVNDDARQDVFQHVAEVRTALPAGRVLIIDFDREAGGVQFR